MALGQPVGVMLANTTSAELTEYMALERIEGPIGEQRADFRAGVLAASIVNHSMAPPKKAAQPADFMMFLPPKPKPTQADLAAKLAATLGPLTKKR